MKKKLITLLAVLACAVGSVGLTACMVEDTAHEHAYGDWVIGEDTRWKECACGEKTTAESLSVGLTYTVDGQEYSVDNTTVAEEITLPTAPEKKGYNFGGWYTDNETWENAFTADYFETNSSVASLSIYAKFEIVVYDITFEGVDGLENENVVSYTVEDTVALKAVEMENRYFKGWYLDGELVTEIPQGTTENLTLTAAWAIDFTGTLFKAGTDYDLSNSLPVAEANVTVSGGDILLSTTTDAEGNYSFLELPVGEYTLTYSKTNFITIEIIITVDIHTVKVAYIDVEQSSTVSGSVLQADTDTNPSNNAKIEGATVTLTKRSGTNVLELSTTTDANGAYSFADLTAGIYFLSIAKEGFITVEQFILVEEGMNLVQNMALEVMPEAEEDAPTTGTASGMIYDAAQMGNVGIEGLTLQVRAGVNNITEGDIVCEYTTTANGAYELVDLEAGNYTILVTDSRELADEEERCTTAYFNVKVLAGMTISNQNGSVFSQKQYVNGLTIVLEWGSAPRDLDSHLTGPSGSSRFHIYYGNKTYGNNQLDRDDRDGYGPETTTVDTTTAGVYRFSVHNYSGQSDGIQNSGATVKVYSNGRLLQTFYAPQGNGIYWTVFEYDTATGRINSINTIGSYQNY